MAVPSLRVLLAVNSLQDEKRLGQDIQTLSERLRPSLDLSHSMVWDYEHLANRDGAQLSGLSPWRIRAHAYQSQAGLVVLDQSFPQWREVNFLVGGQPLWESVGLVRPRGDFRDIDTEDIASALSSQALAGYTSIESNTLQRRKGLECMIRNALRNREDSGVQIGELDERDYVLTPIADQKEPIQYLLDSAFANVSATQQDAVRKDYGSARRRLTEALSTFEFLKTHADLDTPFIIDTLRDALRFTPNQVPILHYRRIIELHKDPSRDPKDLLSELQATALLQHGLPMEGGLLDILTRGAFIRSEYNAQEARYALGNATKILDLLETLCQQHPETPWSQSAMQSVYVNRATIARRTPTLYTGGGKEGQLDFSQANKLAGRALATPLTNIQSYRVQYEQGIIAAFEAEDLAMHGLHYEAAQAALHGLAFLNFDLNTLEEEDPSWAAYLAKGAGLVHTAAIIASPLQDTSDRMLARKNFDAALEAFTHAEQIALSGGPRAGHRLPDLYGNLGTLYGYAALAELGTSEELAQFRDNAVKYTSRFASLHASPPYNRFAQKVSVAFGRKE